MASLRRFIEPALLWLYYACALGTFVKLMFFDGFAFNSWNWIPAALINAFFASIWPLYWPFFRH